MPSSPQKTELTGDEIAAAGEKGSIVDYVKGLKEQDATGEALLPTEPGK